MTAYATQPSSCDATTAEAQRKALNKVRSISKPAPETTTAARRSPEGLASLLQHHAAPSGLGTIADYCKSLLAVVIRLLRARTSERPVLWLPDRTLGIRETVAAETPVASLLPVLT